MWIALGILGGIAVLITVILLLPVRIIIKNDENNELILRYKFLFKTFGEDPDPNDPIVKALKTASGIDRLETKAIQKNIQSDGLHKTVSGSFATLVDLLKEVVSLLKRCKVTKLVVFIRCTGDGADEAAVHYGQSCTAVYSLLNLLRSFVKVRKRGCKIDVGCDFLGTESVFRYDAVLTILAGRVLAGLWRTVMAEAKRAAAEPQKYQKKTGQKSPRK